MNEKQLKDAVDFNANQVAAGKLTGEDQAWLVEYFQRAHRLKIDGKAGSLETIPALRKWIAEQMPPREWKTRGSGYYPTSSRHGSAENRLEGGPVDRRGVKLRTLQGFLAGEDEYVSCAMDPPAFPYGTKLRIPELEKKYGRVIEFRVVDTGGAFYGKDKARIDICTADKPSSVDKTINGPLTLVEVK